MEAEAGSLKTFHATSTLVRVEYKPRPSWETPLGQDTVKLDMEV